MTAKCPHCEKPVSQIEIEDVDMTVLSRPQLKGFAYLCPHCRKILSVQVNPLILQDNLLKRIVESLRNLFAR
jgi:phage terminase large subunit GpA-like protein